MDPPLIRRLEGRRMFERTMVFLSWRLARTLEGAGRHAAPAAAAAAGGVRGGPGRGAGPSTCAASGRATCRPRGVDPVLALVWAIGAACALGAAWQAKFHRLAALILLGGAGLVVCVTFVWFSAPDLALTQLPVEVVTTVLLLLGLRWLPKRFDVPGSRASEAITHDAPPARPRHRRRRRRRHGGAVLRRDDARLRPNSWRSTSWSAPTREGGGTNVVNVILVDFRGFDTLGEITVLGAVALTVYALLRRFRPAPDSVDVPEQQRDQSAYDIARPDRERGRHRRGLAAGPLHPHAAAVPGDLRGRAVPAAARPRPAGRRLRRRG